VPTRRSFRSPKAARKVLDAYAAARDDFLSDVCTMSGVSVAVLDGETLSISKPGTRQ
jgi:hypothetical protein